MSGDVIWAIVTDASTGTPAESPWIAVVADAEHAEYVLPGAETSPFFNQDRIDRITSRLRPAARPRSPQDWLRLATSNLGRNQVSQPQVVSDLDAARRAAKAAL